MPLSICIVGAKGRMGQAIAEAVVEAGHTVGAAADQGDDLSSAIAQCDAVIDFSYHTVTESVFKAAVAHGKPVVSGTTGHTPEEKAALLEIAKGTRDSGHRLADAFGDILQGDRH